MGTINFSKGAISVDIQTQEVTENLTNKLFLITPPQTKSNQSEGVKDTKIVDLLRITREWILRSYITPTSTKTAKNIKEELISLTEGAGTNGGTITMTYDEDAFTGTIEKLTITENSRDILSGESNLNEDSVRYDVTLTFVKGIQI